MSEPPESTEEPPADAALVSRAARPEGKSVDPSATINANPGFSPEPGQEIIGLVSGDLRTVDLPVTSGASLDSDESVEGPKTLELPAPVASPSTVPRGDQLQSGTSDTEPTQRGSGSANRRMKAVPPRPKHSHPSPRLPQRQTAVATNSQTPPKLTPRKPHGPPQAKPPHPSPRTNFVATHNSASNIFFQARKLASDEILALCKANDTKSHWNAKLPDRRNKMNMPALKRKANKTQKTNLVNSPFLTAVAKPKKAANAPVRRKWDDHCYFQDASPAPPTPSLCSTDGAGNRIIDTLPEAVGTSKSEGLLPHCSHGCGHTPVPERLRRRWPSTDGRPPPRRRRISPANVSRKSSHDNESIYRSFVAPDACDHSLEMVEIMERHKTNGGLPASPAARLFPNEPMELPIRRTRFEGDDDNLTSEQYMDKAKQRRRWLFQSQRRFRQRHMKKHEKKHEEMSGDEEQDGRPLTRAVALDGDSFVYEKSGLRIGPQGLLEVPEGVGLPAERDLPQLEDFLVAAYKDCPVMPPPPTGMHFRVQDSVSKDYYSLCYYELVGDQRVQAYTEIMLMLTNKRHPHLLGLYEAYLLPDTLQIAAVYEDCGQFGTLQNIIKRHGFMPESVLATVVRQVLTAVQWLHETQFMIHNAIDCTTLICSYDGSLKLAGLRQAVILEGPNANHEGHIKALAFQGLPRLMSPERLLRLGYGYSSDIWSVGVLAHYLATGVHLFDPAAFESMIDFKACVTHHKRLPFATGISYPVRTFVELCCHKGPAYRPSAQKLLRTELFDENPNSRNTSQLLRFLRGGWKQQLVDAVLVDVGRDHGDHDDVASPVSYPSMPSTPGR
mmetsp:Transcript_1563/g.3529  ORF Transcript_1563/g.3529 Transcript_1563/m.3529 type:complete len:838 (+) Transcript_1563:36-2549(+)